MVYRSLKDWNKKGKKVIKGERASARSSSGVCLFSRSQVEGFKTKRVRAWVDRYQSTVNSITSDNREYLYAFGRDESEYEDWIKYGW